MIPEVRPVTEIGFEAGVVGVRNHLRAVQVKIRRTGFCPILRSAVENGGFLIVGDEQELFIVLLRMGQGCADECENKDKGCMFFEEFHILLARA